MAFAAARQGIERLSSSLFTSLSGRAGIGGAHYPTAAAAATDVATSRRIANTAHLLFVSSLPAQKTRAPVSVTSPRGSHVRGSGGTSGGGGCFEDAVALLASAPVLPKLVVLDLDFTVWPFYCYKRQVSGNGAPPTVYPQVVDIVRALASCKVELAIASRTPSATVAKTFLEQLSISQHFPSKEIYFTIYSKVKHFTALNEKTGIPYCSMLFFDDELKNISAASKLGVTGILVDTGLDLKSLRKGLNAFASKNM